MDLRRPEIILPQPSYPLWIKKPYPMKKPHGNPKYYRRRKRRPPVVIFN